MTLFSRPATLVTILLLSTGIPSTALAGQASNGKSKIAIWEPDLVPSGATAGECYARVRIPAEYSTSTQSVMVEESYSRLAVSQPELASHQEQVLTKEASVRYEVRQPVYETVSEQFMVRPPYNKLSVSEPEFNRVIETIQTTAARLVWKRGNPGRLRAQGYIVHSTADDRVRRQSSTRRSSSNAVTQFKNQFPATHCGPTCEIWCLVEEPGENISFNRKVMTSPGEVKHVPVPAKYTTISKQVVIDPGGVREIPVEAEYKSVTVEKIIGEGSQHLVDVPAKYGSVDKRTLIKAERYEWRRAVCAPGTLRRSNSPTHSITGSGTGYGVGYGAGATQTSRSSSSSSYSSSSSSSSGSSYTSTTTGSGATHKSPSSRNTGTTKDGRTYYYGTNKPVE